MPSSHLILCHPLLLLPPIPPSIRVFCNESSLRMRCPKYWRFSFSIIPSKEIPGLISFRMDWLDLLMYIHSGYSPWGCKRVRNDLVAKQQQPTIFVCVYVCVCVCGMCVHIYTHTYSGYFIVHCCRSKSSYV